jgi:hypothetical protein
MTEIGVTLARSDTSSSCGVFPKTTGQRVSASPVPFKEPKTSGIYYPELARSMRIAFDLVWNHVSSRFEDPETARRILAVQILHHADRGEHKVGGLATAAVDDLLALAGACDDHLS